MSKVIVDTDVLIGFLRGHEAAKIFLLEMTEHSIPCCSVMSVAELYAGVRPQEIEVTADLIDRMAVLPVTRQIAEVAGHFKNRTKHRRLELADCLIAATAFVEDASVATGNAKDYPMPEITVLPAPR